MDRLTENTLYVINNPALLKKQFVDALLAYGADYDVAKTVAMYVDPYQAVVVGATTVDFVPAATIYPKGEHFLITAIRALAGAAATLAATVWVAGIADGLTQNGNWVLTNNGSVELKNQPWTVFQPGSNSPDSGLFMLPKPVMWISQTNLKLTGFWTVAPTTANYNARVELVGIKLI